MRIIISGGVVSSDMQGRRLGNKKKKKLLYKLLIFLAIIIFMILIILRYSEARVRPIITGMAEAHAIAIGSRIIDEAISEGITYDDLISFEKAADGRISVLKTNIFNINMLKSTLSVVILDKLAELEDINLYIPAGNLIRGDFLSGRGPRVQVILLPVGTVTTDIRNVFASAGINQTRHQIMLDVSVTISIIMPFAIENIDIFTSVPIAETIIIGDVPNISLMP